MGNIFHLLIASTERPDYTTQNRAGCPADVTPETRSQDHAGRERSGHVWCGGIIPRSLNLLLSIFANDIVPIFAIAGVGFLLARHFNASVETVSKVSFNALSPCLVFSPAPGLGISRHLPPAPGPADQAIRPGAGLAGTRRCLVGRDARRGDLGSGPGPAADIPHRQVLVLAALAMSGPNLGAAGSACPGWCAGWDCVVRTPGRTR